MTDEDEFPGEIIEPENVRAWLDDTFAKAEADGLSPEWEDDRMGFWLDCPHVEHDHRIHLRPVAVRVLPAALAFGPVFIPLTPNDSATGPAA